MNFVLPRVFCILLFNNIMKFYSISQRATAYIIYARYVMVSRILHLHYKLEMCTKASKMNSSADLAYLSILLPPNINIFINI